MSSITLYISTFLIINFPHNDLFDNNLKFICNIWYERNNYFKIISVGSYPKEAYLNETDKKQKRFLKVIQAHLTLKIQLFTRMKNNEFTQRDIKKITCIKKNRNETTLSKRQKMYSYNYEQKDSFHYFNTIIYFNGIYLHLSHTYTLMLWPKESRYSYKKG